MKKIILIAFVLLTGCRNWLEETAKKETPDAVFYAAKQSMNDRNYDGAIALLQSLGPTYLAQRHVSLVYASAFSGRCGLDFVTLVNSLKDVNATSLFLYLLELNPSGTDAAIADCVFSESILNSVGDHTARISDENILMGLSSMTKVGKVLSRYADADDDGVVDGGFDHCDLNDLPDDAVREVGTGVAQAILSISAVSTEVTTGALTEITALCALDPNLNAFCTTTDKNAYTTNQVRVLRAVLGSTDQGVGACPGSFIACVCP